MKYSRIAITCLAALGLSACSSVTDAPTEQAKSQLPELPVNWQGKTVSGQAPHHWVSAFRDPSLNALVEEAIEHNPDLKASAANVEQALALNHQAASALLPSVNLTASAGREGNVRHGGSRSKLQTGVQVGWEADVWGRLAAGEKATAANLQAQQLDYAFARSSLAAAVTKGYLLVKEAQQQVDVHRKTVASLRQILDIVRLQHQEQLVSMQDVNVAESDLAEAKQRLTSVSKSERAAKRSLELLLGRYPAAQLNLTTVFPVLPPMPSAGLPSDILERRPDLVAAEKRVSEAFNRTSEAKAARLPRIKLTGNLGGASNSLKEILDPANMVWNLGTSILAPVFDGGNLKAQVDAANARQQEALASYSRKALQVFSEVETQLDENRSLREEVSNAHSAYLSAEAAYKVAKLRHKAGDIDLLALSQVQQRALQRQSRWVQLERQQLAARVNLYLALGGDWN